MCDECKKEIEALEARHEDDLERIRTAERRGWDAAITYALMIIKGNHTPHQTLEQRAAVTANKGTTK